MQKRSPRRGQKWLKDVQSCLKQVCTDDAHVTDFVALCLLWFQPACSKCSPAFGSGAGPRRGAAQRNITLVYGGGHVGMMGIVADAALAAGGKVIGVIPKFLVEREVHHRGLTETVTVDSMHARKQLQKGRCVRTKEGAQERGREGGARERGMR